MSNAQENSVKLRDIHYLCPQTVLAHTAGATLVALAGGTGNTQVVLLEESAGVLTNIPMDISVPGIYVTGSYLTP